jgi:hypothetical protein
MHRDDNQEEGMLSSISPEKRVPADHPLRARMQKALTQMNTFS